MTKRKAHRQTTGLFLLLILILLTPGVMAQEPTPSTSETGSSLDPRFGIVDAFVNTAEANVAGAGWTRVFFRWDVIQPAGPSDWKPANVPDTLLDAEVAAGREVAAVLIGTPAWATDSGTSTAAPPLELWGDFVFKIATQYKGRIKHWIIWNQPDITDPASPSYTWAGTEEDYYRLLKEAYQKIKAIDPQMQVHLAGLTYTWDHDRGQEQYLARLLKVILADPQAANENYFFDTVSYHLYYNPHRILEILIDVRSILDAHGLGHKPIWVNETNAPPSEDYLEPLSQPATFHITLEEQSAFVIQAFSLALAAGAERVAFNKMRNEPLHPESIEPYGLLRGDNSRRPAFQAFQVISTHFASVQQTSWLQLGDVYLVTLDRGGQTTTVLWNTSTTPTRYSLNAIASQASLVDEQGNEQVITASNGAYAVELPGATCSNGADCFIDGAPRLIIESGSAAQRAALLPLASPTPSPSLASPSPTRFPDEANPATPNSPAASPIEQLSSGTATPIAPPTLTPTPTPTEAVQMAAAAEALPSDEQTTSPVLVTLLDPGLGQADAAKAMIADDIPSATPATIPPVTIATVLTPDRLLWLFIIGLIVFTVSYGIQVVIWYRLRR